MPAQLFFVRHGEAEHNPLIVKGKAEANDAVLAEGRSILNPRLTDMGKEQAAGLAAQLMASGASFDLCVTTPLFRAIETSHIAFSDVAKRFVVTPEAVETADLKLAAPQRGHSVQQMKETFSFLNDASWDLSLIREEGERPNWVLGEAIEPTEPSGGRCPPAYINPVEVTERIQPLAEWLKALPDERVVVVGHSGVFDKLLGLQMKNCELVEHVLK
jgi:broad specificity phosphatase PhoE